MAIDTEDPNVKPHPIDSTSNVYFNIPRKPVATATVASVDVEKLPPNPQKRPLARLDAFSRVWCCSSRKACIVTTCAAAAVIILIIGLAAGLSLHKSGLSDLPLPSKFGGPYTGDLTYYAPGLGACGVTSSNGDKIVAISHILYDAVAVGSDPNSNPLCGKRIRVKRKGGNASVDLTVVDRCTGCEAKDLDITEDTFAELADVTLGRVSCEWSWLDAHV